MTEINTEVIRRAQDGDAEVIGQLYEQHHLKVFRYLYFRVGDRQTAEDLTSEVFVRMLRFLGGFQPPSASFQAWLIQIARNLSIDYYRKMNAQNMVPLEENMKIESEHPAETVDRLLSSENLRQALIKLSNDQREVIILRFIANMSISEVAQTLNKSEDAVKGLQRRALMGLREVLTEWEVTYA